MFLCIFRTEYFTNVFIFQTPITLQILINFKFMCTVQSNRHLGFHLFKEFPSRDLELLKGRPM